VITYWLVSRVMSVKTMVENIYELLEDAHVDAEKHDNGNSAAGTRVRKAMQQLKGIAQDIRLKVQSDKNSR
jgi:hypothetical protein